MFTVLSPEILHRLLKDLQLTAAAGMAGGENMLQELANAATRGGQSSQAIARESEAQAVRVALYRRVANLISGKSMEALWNVSEEFLEAGTSNPSARAIAYEVREDIRGSIRAALEKEFQR